MRDADRCFLPSMMTLNKMVQCSAQLFGIFISCSHYRWGELDDTPVQPLYPPLQLDLQSSIHGGNIVLCKKSNRGQTEASIAVFRRKTTGLADNITIAGVKFCGSTFALYNHPLTIIATVRFCAILTFCIMFVGLVGQQRYVMYIIFDDDITPKGSTNLKSYTGLQSQQNISKHRNTKLPKDKTIKNLQNKTYPNSRLNVTVT